MLKKFIRLILIISIAITYITLKRPVTSILINLGIIEEEILIAGTGSMYPTFPKSQVDNNLIKAHEIVAWPKMKRYPSGINVLGNQLFSYKISHGDIIEFDNVLTKQLSTQKYGTEAGFVKRVIAVSGDSIELRDGFVYLNRKIIDEPYTASPRSTYGGNFLADCESLIIPENKLLVLGDNRKASLDSRHELGIIDISEVHYYLSFTKQQDYKKMWRNTKLDSSYAQQVTFDSLEFVHILNEKRREKKIKPYVYRTSLTASSKKRGEIMLSTNDFSTEATKSGITLKRAIKEAGYNNIIMAEFFTKGYYEAKELIENFLEFPDTYSLLFSDTYQDIGLSATIDDVNSCPTQVIVVHLGGFIPPDYTQAEIESWNNLIKNIEEIKPSWEKLREAEFVDQEKLSRLLILLETRLQNAKIIYKKMSSNDWLNDSERNLANLDKDYAKESENLTNNLFEASN